VTLIFAGKRGHHNNFNVACFGGASKNIKHVEAGNFWHHNVTDDKSRSIFDSHSKRFFTIPGRNDVVTLCEKTNTINFSQAFVVFDQ
jgi:hypothetical protein